MRHKTAFFYMALVFLQAAACSDPETAANNGTSRESSTRPDAASFYPLEVGNRWTYRCSVEGEHAFDKTLSIVGSEIADGVKYYRAELLVGDDSNPLVLYYSADNKGDVYSSLEKSSEGRKPVITARPKQGDSVGSLSVAAEEQIETPASGRVTAIRLENFTLEDPGLSEEKRMEWEGKFYARGVGLVAEVDGIGGECVLTEFFQGGGK